VYSEFKDDLILLELDESASISDLKEAYRELAKVWHPDRFKDDPKLAEKANKKLTEINAAYERLQKHFQSRRHTSSTPPPRSEEQTEPKQNPKSSKKHYHEDSILHRLFSLFFWFTVWGGVCLLTGATLMLGFSTEPKPTHIIENIVLFFLGICASPVLLLAAYRTFLYIIYGSKVAFKFKNLWQAAFLPTLLLIVLMIIGYLLTIFGDSKGAQITRLKQVQSVTPIIEQEQERQISYKSNNASTVSKPSISIHYAAFDGDIKAIKKHLDAGTDVNAKDEDGYTPLYAVASFDQKKIAELLIAKGADVNVNVDGTPLHHAVLKGRKEIAELLVAAGADVNAKDKEGKTPLDWAKRHPENADLLRKHGGKTSEELKAERKQLTG